MSKRLLWWIGILIYGGLVILINANFRTMDAPGSRPMVRMACINESSSARANFRSRTTHWSTKILQGVADMAMPGQISQFSI